MLARLPLGQTRDSRWVGESGRYLPRSGKPQPRRGEERRGEQGVERWKESLARTKWGVDPCYFNCNDIRVPWCGDLYPVVSDGCQYCAAIADDNCPI